MNKKNLTKWASATLVSAMLIGMFAQAQYTNAAEKATQSQGVFFYDANKNGELDESDILINADEINTQLGNLNIDMYGTAAGKGKGEGGKDQKTIPEQIADLQKDITDAKNTYKDVVDDSSKDAADKATASIKKTQDDIVAYTQENTNRLVDADREVVNSVERTVSYDPMTISNGESIDLVDAQGKSLKDYYIARIDVDYAQNYGSYPTYSISDGKMNIQFADTLPDNAGRKIKINSMSVTYAYEEPDAFQGKSDNNITTYKQWLETQGVKEAETKGE